MFFWFGRWPICSSSLPPPSSLFSLFARAYRTPSSWVLAAPAPWNAGSSFVSDSVLNEIGISRKKEEGEKVIFFRKNFFLSLSLPLSSLDSLAVRVARKNYYYYYYYYYYYRGSANEGETCLRIPSLFDWLHSRFFIFFFYLFFS